MKVLFLVHTEEIFRNYFPPDYDELILGQRDYFDHIIVLDSEIENDVIGAAKEVADEIWSWSWGYEPGQFCDLEDEDWVILSSGAHAYTWVPYDLRSRLAWFKEQEIFIAGGSYAECLEDWRAVLRYMDLDFQEVPYLVY